jgi:orotidine-5'-phosphate decarboxylase
MGSESLAPFLAQEGKSICVLCRTSNPGAGEFQDLDVGGVPLYQRVARAVVETWNKNSNVSLMVGATVPAELAEARKIAGPDMPILTAGVGAQGGDIGETVQAGVGTDGGALMINVSRGVLFADDPRAAAQKVRDEINQYRKEA